MLTTRSHGFVFLPRTQFLWNKWVSTTNTRGDLHFLQKGLFRSRQVAQSQSSAPKCTYTSYPVVFVQLCFGQIEEKRTEYPKVYDGLNIPIHRQGQKGKGKIRTRKLLWIMLEPQTEFWRQSAVDPWKENGIFADKVQVNFKGNWEVAVLKLLLQMYPGALSLTV